MTRFRSSKQINLHLKFLTFSSVRFVQGDDITIFFDLFEHDRCRQVETDCATAFPRRDAFQSRESRGQQVDRGRRCSTLVWMLLLYGSSRARIARRPRTRIVSRIARFSTLRYKRCKICLLGCLPSYWCITDHVEKEYKLDKPLLVRHTRSSGLFSLQKRHQTDEFPVTICRNDSKR